MRLLFSLFLGLSLVFWAPAAEQKEIIATTESGKKVVLLPDGTWKYKDPVPAAGAHTRSDKATEKLEINRGQCIFYYDPSRWKMKSGEPAKNMFTHVSGDGYGMVIAERIQTSLTSLRDVALTNAKQVAPDAKIIMEAPRQVNGRELLCMQIAGTIQGIKFLYYGYYYSGKEGTIQIITYTGENLFDEYRKDFEEFLNGFTVGG